MKSHLALLTASALLQCIRPECCFAEEQLVPLKTEMATISEKQELYDCAPFQTKVKPCEPELTEVPVIKVPEGTINLSKGKPVTSSDPNPIIGDLEMITDGDKVLQEGGYVELLDGPQWVQIDLGRECDIYVIWIWHLFNTFQKTYKIAFRDVIVQISNDGKFAKSATTVFNNDTDNSAKLGKGTDLPYIETRFGKPIILAKPVKGRYVRLYSNGNDILEANQYVEVEVFGSPAKPVMENPPIR